MVLQNKLCFGYPRSGLIYTLIDNGCFKTCITNQLISNYRTNKVVRTKRKVTIFKFLVLVCLFVPGCHKNFKFMRRLLPVS